MCTQSPQVGEPLLSLIHYSARSRTKSVYVSTPVACGGGQSVANRSAVRGFPPLGRLRRLRPVVGTVRWKPYQERWLTKALLTAPLREATPRLQTFRKIQNRIRRGF
ncbi:hypothetical protein QUB80_33895 [Chlorogloeopsis sp. ULAP01]|uniref:hypothetical protein n=1 Tax=Chlorogloeopsis sp. ULAP01 TaxID=3056483 RepID=UPI0025AB1B21|nr:hypothetical protein [Chlorogloeopsis sp. ULAP01]MDM9385651.1 hypothetical protein [Chlorogloeopsis sp. ULAP01]